MPTTLDIFNDDAFSVQSLTAAVNNEPSRPGQIGRAGIFEEDGVTTTIISVEQRDGKLALVEPSERGGPGETSDDEDRKLVPIPVPHYERNDTVMAEEVQGVRAFGSASDVEQVEDRVNRKAMRHSDDLEMTLEHQRVGAIKGIVTSKSGKVLTNLYTTFGIAVPAAISLDLNNTDAKPDVLLEEDVAWEIEDRLDSQYENFHAWTGRNFHKLLWSHPRIRDTYLATDRASALRGPMPDIIEYGKFRFERYKTGKSARTDLGDAYIGDDEARVTPTGVPGLFITRFAPADYIETVNTMGLPRYAKVIAMRNGKGAEMEVQMNAISVCTRPTALQRLTI